jgi:hypothetical protein
MSDFVNECKYNPTIIGLDLLSNTADTLQITFRDEESKEMFEAMNSVSMLKTPHRVQKKKQTMKAKPMSGDKVKRLGSTKTMLKNDKENFKPHMMYDPKTGKGFKADTYQDHLRMDKMGYVHTKPKMKSEKKKMHKCATKVEHSDWGVGSCIREQHASPDAEGNIAWYDVMFEHGLERGVPSDDLSVLLSEMHEDHDHHDGESIDEKVSSLKKSDAPFTVVATKGGKVVGNMHSLKHNEISDAIQFMKTDNKGAKISVEAKGGKVVHTESRDRFDYLDRQAASQDRQIAAKKFMDALKKAKIKAQYSRPSGTVFVLKNDLSKAQSIGKRLNILRDGITIRASMSVKEDVNERRFDPSKNPTAKTDKEFDDCKNALVKAGIPHMGMRAIGSMGRERNKFRVHPKFEKKARQILKKFKGCDLEINDKMPEQPMVRKMKKEDVQLDEMSAKAHYNKMKAQGKVGRGGRVVTPIDKNRFPNREREGLEGPFRNRKTSLIYYYDKKAGKYYDPQSDMYLDVKDVMDSVEEGLRQDLKDLKKNEGLRQAMSGPKETPAQKRKRQEKDNYDLYKKRQKRIAALRGDKSSRKLSPGQEKHYRQTVNLSQLKALSGMKKKKNESKIGVEEAVKYPHNMYDPKSGKRYVAKNREDHMRMSRMGYDHVPKAMNKSTTKKEDVNEDRVMERELELFIVNDANIYRQRITPIIKNMQRKSKSGKYDAELAIKGFMYAVNDGIKAYNKEFGSGAMKLDKSSKMKVAKAVRDRFADEFK